MRGIRRMSIACIFPPILIAYGALRYTGWLNPNASLSFNLKRLLQTTYNTGITIYRTCLIIFVIGGLGFSLEKIGIHRNLFYAAVGLSTLYILIETFVLTKHKDEAPLATVDLRDY